MEKGKAFTLMSIYLERYAFPSLNIKGEPNSNTDLIVVIPVFNESNLLTALQSLFESTLPPVHTEVLIIINQAANCSVEIAKQNEVTLNSTVDWIAQHSKKGIRFYVKKIELANKHAGVGLARKAGMDEAIRRFEQINNTEGIILCYDADCSCAPNYLSDVYKSFKISRLHAASIYFEHQLKNLPNFEKEGIIQYELHLRYYVNGLRKAGYPYAFHTVGSSMAVSASIYKKAGGMNKRKAGEDFHFLHKVIPYGNFEEITTTVNYPSPRISFRVPFGTGKAMADWKTNQEDYLISYHPQIFKELATLLKQVPGFYKNSAPDAIVNRLAPSIQAYLKKENYVQIFNDINRQSSNLSTFIHRWYGWFNGLKALHFVHFLRDNFYPSIPIIKAAAQLFELPETSAEELLMSYRTCDKNFKSGQISLKHLYAEHL